MVKSKSKTYWSKLAKQLLAELKSSSANGLSDAEAVKRLAAAGPNAIAARKKTPGLHLLLNQFKNPLNTQAVFTPKVPPPTTMISLLFFSIEFRLVFFEILFTGADRNG